MGDKNADKNRILNNPPIDRSTLLQEVSRNITDEETPSVHPEISFFDALPQALNTRRRYSAFRPVLFPGQYDSSDQQSKTVTEEYETAEVMVLDEKDYIVRKNFMAASMGEKTTSKIPSQGASDLEVFLQEHYQGHDKEKPGDSIDTDAKKTEQGKMGRIKERSWPFLVFVILLGIITFGQLITTICCFVLPELLEIPHNHSMHFNKSSNKFLDAG